MQRFYFDIVLGSEISIEDKDFFHQISHVLRSRIWDEVVIFNGDSFEYVYSIESINKKSIGLRLKIKELNDADPDLKINLYQAIPNKFEKIDFILQKWVEVGISSFTLFKWERSSKLVISENKIGRFENIIKEALEQCAWNRRPEVNVTDKLDLNNLKWRSFVCDTLWTKRPDFKLNLNEEINIFVWPEWGFSDKELESFRSAWIESVNFWKRILRTETIWVALAFSLINGIK
ncbi:MAG: hypothetical protein ACD_3C00029G0009 [uncultured bacterium (gcode 4)]|uniref:Ribosomal RNA small subunit methyltransferase E n=1 Tax=uncultured bacterium (gcode 4) TaxID=1234023 RepID=K2FCC1_9BACT|nr:MAG: hypothetical protein ACD_3C00029G0009 [uncultured bacterium (gcode 4)]